MLRSRYRRAGAPVLLAFGAGMERGGLHVGLLFISAQLDPLDYVLYDVDTDEQTTVRLPEALLDMPKDRMKTNVVLEVVNGNA